MSFYERDSGIIEAQGLPLTLLDLCLQRGLHGDRVLRGTRLFMDDLIQRNPRISQEQLLQLADNAERLLDSSDSAFLLGQRLLPGNLHGASQLLSQAPNLFSALESLVEFAPLLSPLLSPRLVVDENYGYLYWLDSCGTGKQWRFLLEASATAVAAFSRRHRGEHLPWQFHFRHSRPPYIEQYWVHLGETLHFDQPCDMLRVPRQWLFEGIKPAGISHQVALQQARQQLQTLPAPRPLLVAVYHHLEQQLKQPANHRTLQLESVAESLGMSPATFKRHLKKHGTHFQQQLDLARLHTAIYLLRSQGLGTEAVARQLGFHDSAGLRRSFKRWTGSTPSSVLAL
ncbi:AraC family transcriptional regulator [Parahaliea maris]|uniref:AraC family transcriptional regulator n=2 Tax=Parahaliea maris TaxID=2716870 RepID=A0A5C8ZQP2_9GAMM|nr:AraC family transcriptional regulator [Parahaliea maris]